MNFGVIIIGDEILSGKRQDKHLSKAIATLGERGLGLSWANYLGDDPDLITETFKRTFASGDTVFSFGGIGATPDDHTRQCAARAAGVPLRLHPEAEAEIRGRFVEDPRGVTPQRLMMGEFPEGAAIIPNPYNR
ncbi:MAG: competence/damage-inducible protein A, partial [Vulcanococcus sp.]